MFRSVLLSDVAISQPQLIIVVLGVLVGVFALAWLAKGNQKLIKLRKRAVDLAAFNNEIGLNEAADFFEDFAVNDIDGMWESGEAMLKIAANPDLRAAVLARVVDKYIGIALQKDLAEVTRLQGLLAGTAAQAAAAGETGLDVKGLVAALLAAATAPANNNSNGNKVSSVGKTTITTTPAPVSVQPPATQTTVEHSIVGA